MLSVVMVCFGAVAVGLMIRYALFAERRPACPECKTPTLVSEPAATTSVAVNAAGMRRYDEAFTCDRCRGEFRQAGPGSPIVTKATWDAGGGRDDIPAARVHKGR